MESQEAQDLKVLLEVMDRPGRLALLEQLDERVQRALLAPKVLKDPKDLPELRDLLVQQDLLEASGHRVPPDQLDYRGVLEWLGLQDLKGQLEVLVPRVSKE